uniref:CysS_3 protein n=1 Tax=Fopius arisanus TaxID=64838 RepID=A0A0C9QHH4_9HYME
MPHFEAILSKEKSYNRLIKCIVSNSYLKYFTSSDNLPKDVIGTCIKASSNFTHLEDHRVHYFLCQVELYRDTIIQHCQQFAVDDTLAFEAPRKYLEFRILSFLDSKREDILKKNKRGKPPKSVPFFYLKQAALCVNKLILEFNSSDHYLRYIYSIYTAIGHKWWRTRVLNGENVEPGVTNPAQDSVEQLSLPNKKKRQTEMINSLPLKKRILQNLRLNNKNDDFCQVSVLSSWRKRVFHFLCIDCIILIYSHRSPRRRDVHQQIKVPNEN